MRLKTTYEWCIETLEDGDIVDNHFEDKLKDLPLDDMESKVLVLCRVEGNEIEGVTNTLWAYVVDGVLPEYFANEMNSSTSYKVPVKFHKELSRELTKQNN